MFDTAHIHPMLVHFPVALTLLGVVLEALSLFKPRLFKYPCGEILLYFGTLSAILAATAGSLFTPDFKTPELIQAKDIHGMFGGITVTLLCLASVAYAARYIFHNEAGTLRKIGFGFYALAAVCVAVTGFLGGVIVYNDLLKM